MRRQRLQLKHAFFAAAFLLALLIRAAGAVQNISTDAEAALALQALAVFGSQDVLLLPHSAYLVLTAPLMFIFGAFEWVARFWPVIAGSLLVLTPAMFQRWLGLFPAVLLAFFLALDPGMVAVSLHVGSLSLVLLFVLLALGFWVNGKAAFAGISAGLALLGGPPVWPGIIGLGVAFALTNRLTRNTGEEEKSNSAGTGVLPAGAVSPADRRTVLLFALATLFFVGTLFFSLPRGLSAAAASLPAYLRGWAEPSNVPVLRLLLALLVYEFLFLPFGIYGGISGWLRKNRADQFLLTWFAVLLVLLLLYPGRQVSDLVWSILPLAALAARQITQIVYAPVYDRLATFGQVLLAALILGYLSMTLTGLSNNFQAAVSREYAFRLVGAIVMLVASTALIAWGWSKQVAVRGLTWGFALILLIYTISSTWNTSGLSGRMGRELWSGSQRLPAAYLLHETIDLLNQWAGPVSGTADLVVVGVDSSSLRWSLRNLPNVQYANFLSTEANPALVITTDDPTVSLGAAYRGQDFILAENVDWSRVRPIEWYRWLVFRTLPAELILREQAILWARTDIFPGGEVAESPIEEIEQFNDQVSPR